jgi:hypothetical protein
VANSLKIRYRKASIFYSAVLPHLAAKVMNRAIKFGKDLPFIFQLSNSMAAARVKSWILY